MTHSIPAVERRRPIAGRIAAASQNTACYDASFHRVDALLTWNCRHLANPNKMEHIRLVNYEVGLPMPLLTTPLNYLSGDESYAR